MNGENTHEVSLVTKNGNPYDSMTDEEADKALTRAKESVAAEAAKQGPPKFRGLVCAEIPPTYSEQLSQKATKGGSRRQRRLMQTIRKKTTRKLLNSEEAVVNAALGRAASMSPEQLAEAAEKLKGADAEFAKFMESVAAEAA